MPLEFVSDKLDDAAHKQLDEELSEAFANHGEEWSARALLSAIVADSREFLDQQYTQIKMAQNLLRTEHPELQELLQVAWEKKSFRDIRNLKILRKDQDFSRVITGDGAQSIVSSDTNRTAMEKSWETEYVGSAADSLYDTLALYDTRNNDYARYFSVVQSSGMGKSRMVDELAKKHLVIPLNLRVESTGYPTPDVDVREWFLTECSNTLALRRSHAFLSALFIKAKEVLSIIDQKITTLVYGLPPDKYPQTQCDKFRLFMTAGQNFHSQGQNRVGFYDEVLKLADQFLENLSPDLPQTPRKDTKQSPASPTPAVRFTTGNTTFELKDIANDLMQYLHPGFDVNDKYKPLLIVALDEAHTLTKIHKSDKDGLWSKFSQLRRALRAINAYPIYFLFLSTTGKITQFTLSPNNDLSSRVVEGVLILIHPFTDVGFDQMAQKVAGDGSVTLTYVSSDGFMARLGRPLFGLFFEHGDAEIRKSIVHFAAQKLLCGAPLNSQQKLPEDAELACLSVRLALEFNATTYASKEREQVQVEKHMRVCLAVDPGFETAVTVAASEPLLAEAALRCMENSKFQVPQALLYQLERPGLSKGDRGELLAMVVLMLARDAVYKASRNRVISLIDFVKQLFPASVHAKILQAKPSVLRTASEDQTFAEAFKGSRIYFNHFIKVNDFALINREYLWRLKIRGAAVLCANNQAGADIVVPFCYWDERLKKTNISAFLIQVKNDKKYSTTPRRFLFDNMNPFFLHLFDKDDKDPLPVIRMVFALASKEPAVTIISQPARSNPSRSSKRPRYAMQKYTAYDIWCAQASSSTFGPISWEDEAVYQALLKISHDHLSVYNRKEKVPSARSACRNMNPATAVHDDHWSRFVKDGDVGEEDDNDVALAEEVEESDEDSEMEG